MMTRRDLLLVGAGAVALETVGVRVAAAAEGAPKADAPEQTHGAFQRAAQGCVDAGTACLQHCLTLLGKGDTSMAECAHAVNAMLAVCKAIGPLAAADSTHLKSAAPLCLDVCTDCEKACRPHLDHHAVCKACAEACTATIAEAKKIAA